MSDQLLSIRAAAEQLGVSRGTIFRLLNSGDLPRVRIGGRTLIKQSDIDALVERSTERDD